MYWYSVIRLRHQVPGKALDFWFRNKIACEIAGFYIYYCCVTPLPFCTII